MSKEAQTYLKDGEIPEEVLWRLVEVVDADEANDNYLTYEGVLVPAAVGKRAVNTIEQVAPISKRPDFMRIEHALFALHISDLHKQVEAEGGLVVPTLEIDTSISNPEEELIRVGLLIGQALNEKRAIHESMALTPNQRFRIARYNAWGGQVQSAHSRDLQKFQQDSVAVFFDMVGLMARGIVKAGIESEVISDEDVTLALYADIMADEQFGKIIAEAMNTGNAFWGGELITMPDLFLSSERDEQDEEEMEDDIVQSEKTSYYWNITGPLAEGQFRSSQKLLDMLKRLKDKQNAGKNPDGDFVTTRMPTIGCPLLHVQVHYSNDPLEVSFLTPDQISRLTVGENPLAITTPRHRNQLFITFSIVDTLLGYYIDALRSKPGGEL